MCADVHACVCVCVRVCMSVRYIVPNNVPLFSSNGLHMTHVCWVLVISGSCNETVAPLLGPAQGLALYTVVLWFPVQNTTSCTVDM